jgi:hypothetical protein
MQTGQWGDFVNGVSARVNQIIDETKDMGPSFQSYGIHKTETNVDSLIFRTEGVTGLSYLELFTEDGAIKEDRTYPAYKTEYVMKDFGKIITISQKLAKTRPAELESKLDEVKQLRIAATRTLNKYAWQPLVDGFVTTNSNANFPTFRLSDAVALYSASHPSLVAGVANRSNILAGNPALDEPSLFLAMKQIREQLNGRGLPVNYEGKFTLVVPPALEKLAKEIVKSELRSDTMNNDLNYYKGTMTDVLVVNYLGAANGGSDTAWYVFATDAGDQASLRYVPLIEPKIEQEVDFDTKAIRVSIDCSMAFGYSNFEFTVASQGTNS